MFHLETRPVRSNIFRDLPGYASREVIAIISSLSTCDPSNIFATFEVNFFLGFTVIYSSFI